MAMKKGEYDIKEITKGFYEMIKRDRETGRILEIYYVDIILPSCSCPAFKYSNRTKTGRKRSCKHILICKNLINPK